MWMGAGRFFREPVRALGGHPQAVMVERGSWAVGLGECWIGRVIASFGEAWDGAVRGCWVDGRDDPVYLWDQWSVIPRSLLKRIREKFASFMWKR